MFFSRSTIFASALLTLATPTLANDVNVYSYRQPELVKPLFDAFTAQSGIKVNVQFLKKGLVEKLVAEGNRSPADVILTVDISRLNSVVEAGVTQPVVSEVLKNNIPAEFRDPENQWFALTTRARIAYASKERVLDGEVTTYEDFADPKWKNRICTRSGTNAYNLALTSAVIANHGEDVAKSWLLGVKSNLARKPQGNDRAQVKAIYAGECDISVNFNDAGRSFAISINGVSSGVNVPQLATSSDGVKFGFTGYSPLIDIAKLRPASLKLTEIVAFDE